MYQTLVTTKTHEPTGLTHWLPGFWVIWGTGSGVKGCSTSTLVYNYFKNGPKKKTCITSKTV